MTAGAQRDGAAIYVAALLPRHRPELRSNSATTSHHAESRRKLGECLPHPERCRRPTV